MAGEREIVVEEDGRELARATIRVGDANGEARAEVCVTAGHLPVTARQKVVDAVFAAVGEKQVRHLTATVPLGDAELVQRLGSHLNDVELRAAGATCIIKGEVRAC